ncbi:two-component regulator propeller domain-containing protein [Gramella sp. AN32]|uniref:two-component regulator propeller domain-containing protein n=1 Tax=Gramella sp. AN32 TaxID=2183748 RepID=UPI00204449FB
MYSLMVLYFILSHQLFSQEHPPIINFQPSEYNGENQNWGISQDENGFIYIANNDGLLEFNGARWSLYKSPNFSIMRSVLAFDGLIYAGYHREFGFWKRNNLGVLKYSSLSDSLPSEMFEDENIWNIKQIDEWIIFQSYNRIYFYNPDTGKITFNTDVDNYYRIFNVSDRLYLQKKDRSVYLLRNGEEELITQLGNEFDVRLVLSIFETDNKNLLFLTRKKGIFILKNSKVEQWDFPAKEIISQYQIFGGIQLRNGSLVLGTISNGIIVLDSTGNLKYQIDKSNSLGNNTVLSLFEDSNNNVWAGLDNGIDCLNMNSYITEYFDSSGKLGTIYASAIKNGNLYLGTNQGLFLKKLNAESNPRLVAGTKGQVWALKTLYGDLLCGHTEGTFLINDDSATLISNVQGAWDFKLIPEHPNKILTGNYHGLSILEKLNDTWRLRNEIEGFKYSSRFFEIMNGNEIWVNHEYKGIFKLEVDPDFQKIIRTELSSKIPKGENSGILKYNSDLLYYTKDGIFKIDTKAGTISKDSILNKIALSNQFLSGKMIEDSSKRLWTFSKESIVFTEQSPVYGEINTKSIPLNLESRKTTVSFENIFGIGDDKYFIGGTNNYLLLDLKKLNDAEHKIFLNSVLIGGTDDKFNLVNKEGNLEFPYNKRSLRFRYSVPNYHKYEITSYQHRLKGMRDDWSAWENSPSVSFEKLPFGDYTFEVRSKIGEKLSSNTEQFAFTIKRPFYLSNFALLCYILIANLLHIL